VVWQAQELKRAGTRLSSLITSEREKLNVSQADLRGLQGIKNLYTEIMESMIIENSIMEGRLFESTVSE